MDNQPSCSVSAVASGDYARTVNGETGGGPRSGTATSIGLQGRIPLYQGGLPSARIRQAQALEGQALELRIASERAVVATTRSAFADYQAAMDAIKANEVAVKANELALEGIRYWDLLRWGVAGQVLKGDFYGAAYPGAINLRKKGTAIDPASRWFVTSKAFRTGTDEKWPVPQREVNINPKLQ